MNIRRAAAWAALAAALSSCASAPPASSSFEGDEELSVTAILRTPAIDPLTGQVVPATFDTQEIDGVSCTLANDKGSWTAVTPGKVRVQRSRAPLAIECAKEGYRTARWKLECMTPRQQDKKAGGDVDLALSLIAIPAGIVTLPVGGGGLIVQGALGVGEHAYTAGRPDACSYRGILAPLRKLDQ